MIAMGSFRNREIKEKLNIEIYHICKGFEALTIDHKKGVLRTAQGLLRIQRTQKAMASGNSRYIDFSLKD